MHTLICYHNNDDSITLDIYFCSIILFSSFSSYLYTTSKREGAIGELQKIITKSKQKNCLLPNTLDGLKFYIMILSWIALRDAAILSRVLCFALCFVFKKSDITVYHSPPIC